MLPIRVALQTVALTVYVSNAVYFPAALANGLRCDAALSTGISVSNIKLISWTMQGGNVTTFSAADSAAVNSAALVCPASFSVINPATVQPSSANLASVANARYFSLNIVVDDYVAPTVQTTLQTKQTANLVLPVWSTNLWNTTTQVLQVINAAQPNATLTYYPVITRMATSNFLNVLQTASVVTAPTVQNVAQ